MLSACRSKGRSSPITTAIDRGFADREGKGGAGRFRRPFLFRQRPELVAQRSEPFGIGPPHLHAVAVERAAPLLARRGADDAVALVEFEHRRDPVERSEARRVGKEGVRTVSTGWPQYHEHKITERITHQTKQNAPP